MINTLNSALDAYLTHWDRFVVDWNRVDQNDAVGGALERLERFIRSKGPDTLIRQSRCGRDVEMELWTIADKIAERSGIDADFWESFPAQGGGLAEDPIEGISELIQHWRNS